MDVVRLEDVVDAVDRRANVNLWGAFALDAVVAAGGKQM